jgi:hypothetical protein
MGSAELCDPAWGSAEHGIRARWPAPHAAKEGVSTLVEKFPKKLVDLDGFGKQPSRSCTVAGKNH